MKEKRFAVWITLSFLCIALLSACGNKDFKPNGKVRFDHVTVMNEDNPYYQIGFSDYVFVGEILNDGNTATTPSGRQRTTFDIQVIENIKGKLQEKISADYPAYYEKDGTLVLMEGDYIKDNDIPHKGMKYIFVGMAQPDGSIILTDLYAATVYTEEEYMKYNEYVENQEEAERERFESDYDLN